MSVVLQIVLYFVTKTVYFGLLVMQLLMFLRAMLSFMMPDDDNALLDFVYTATEPIIAPIRDFLDRFDFIAALPFDVSFFAAFILLVIVQNLLPTVTL